MQSFGRCCVTAGRRVLLASVQTEQCTISGRLPEHLARCLAPQLVRGFAKEDGSGTVLRWPLPPDALAGADPALKMAMQLDNSNRAADEHMRDKSDELDKLPSRDALQKLKVAELQEELQKLGGRVTSKLRKPELVEQLHASLLARQEELARERRSAEGRIHESRRQLDDGAFLQALPGERGFAKVLPAEEAAQLLVQANADDVCIIDVRQRCDFTEHMVIASGRSHRHVHAVASAVLHHIKHRCREVAQGVPPGIEGDASSDWCLVDAGSVVVHVFMPEARHEYDMEGLWATSPRDIVRVASPQRPLTLDNMKLQDSWALAA